MGCCTQANTSNKKEKNVQIPVDIAPKEKIEEKENRTDASTAAKTSENQEKPIETADINIEEKNEIESQKMDENKEKIGTQNVDELVTSINHDIQKQQNDIKVLQSEVSPSVGFDSHKIQQSHGQYIQSEPVVGLESCVTTMTRRPMPYQGRFSQEQLRKFKQSAIMVGEASYVTTMTRAPQRPNPQNIMYDQADVRNVEIISNPSMNDSINSDDEGPIIGLGSIVSGQFRNIGELLNEIYDQQAETSLGPIVNEESKLKRQNSQPDGLQINGLEEFLSKSDKESVKSKNVTFEVDHQKEPSLDQNEKAEILDAFTTILKNKGDEALKEEEMPELRKDTEMTENSEAELNQSFTRNEQKCRQALVSAGMVAQTEVNRVTLKKKDGVIMNIDKPQVFKNPTDQTFAIFGEMKVLDNQNTMSKEELKIYAIQAPTLSSPQVILEDNGEPLPEDGLTQNHITMVMDHANCSRNKAIQTLRETNDDMVEAVQKLDN